MFLCRFCGETSDIVQYKDGLMTFPNGKYIVGAPACDKCIDDETKTELIELEPETI